VIERSAQPRRFPPPWSVEEKAACFVVRDHNGQALAYVYFEDEPGRRSCRPKGAPTAMVRSHLAALRLGTRLNSQRPRDTQHSVHEPRRASVAPQFFTSAPFRHTGAAHMTSEWRLTGERPMAPQEPPPGRASHEVGGSNEFTRGAAEFLPTRPSVTLRLMKRKNPVWTGKVSPGCGDVLGASAPWEAQLSFDPPRRPSSAARQ
jgi:hypothetical protein